MEFKKPGDVMVQESGHNVNLSGFTKRDEVDMAKQGKRQQFQRNFGFISMLGFTTTLMCTWEAVLFACTTALIEGGPVSLVYGYIFCWVGSLFVAASLAEMASMAPISGAQYHWVSMLAPKESMVFLSWLTGWLSCIGWWANTAAGVFFGATVIQGLLVLNYPDYDYQGWHGTLLMFAALLVCVVVNAIGAKVLPKIEGLILVLHTLGFFAILIPMVYLAPHQNASFVFGQFTNQGGWSNNGLAWFIGLTSSVLPFVGYDGPCHMAEEVTNASVNVPWTMICTILLNGCLGFATVIAFLFCIGDMTEVLGSETGYPFIQVFYNSTNSHAGASVMAAIPCALVICASFGFLASSSRQTWAFARDQGLPFSKFLSHVSTNKSLPLRAVGLCTFLTAIICLINIGSSTAFNAIVSLTTAGLFFSYMIPIILMVRKRILGESIPWGPWSMGPTLGLVVNVLGICFLIITIFFSFFPPEIPVTLINMNWSCVVFGGETLLGLLWFAVWGRKMYKGPIMETPVIVSENHDLEEMQ